MRSLITILFLAFAATAAADPPIYLLPTPGGGYTLLDPGAGPPIYIRPIPGGGYTVWDPTLPPYPVETLPYPVEADPYYPDEPWDAGSE